MRGHKQQKAGLRRIAASLLVVDICCEARFNPDNTNTRVWAEQNVVWTLPDIGNSTKTWVKADGTADDNKGSVAYCRFTNLPENNTDFGLKEVKMTAQGVDTKRNIEVFYTATATNHPNQIATKLTPNWFHYYKQNAGATEIAYNPTGRSYYARTTNQVIYIGNEAYSGDTYAITKIIKTADGRDQLVATDLSATNKYYANFMGALAHERGHRDDEVENADHTPADPGDFDYLSEEFETNTSKTNPFKKFSSIGPFQQAPDTGDVEIYHGGPVEEKAVKGADTSQDWAFPGTNSAPAN